MYNVTFTNIQMSTRYYDPSWWGLAEPIYISACPRNNSIKVGSVNGVHFVNITATSENGIFLSGSKDSLLNGIQFTNFTLKLVKSTTFSGGYHDYRPGCEGLVLHRMSGVFMEYIEDVLLQNLDLHWKEEAHLSDWGLPFDFSPSTVYNMKFVEFVQMYGKSSRADSYLDDRSQSNG